MINARDALEEANAAEPTIDVGGENIVLSSLEAQAHPGGEPGPYVLIGFHDNGVGMDPEIQGHIYEPFFTTKEVDKGTGLGLATNYATVQDHRGWIECDSQVGVGTTFSVYLPVVGGQEGNGAASELQAVEVAGGSETILAVDDEPHIRNYIRRVLEDGGYTVLLAGDGRKGLETYRRYGEQIDLVLLDLSMPVMSGVEMLEELRAAQAQVKVVVFTGYATEVSDMQGVRQIIRKPLRMNELAQVVRDVLDE